MQVMRVNPLFIKPAQRDKNLKNNFSGARGSNNTADEVSFASGDIKSAKSIIEETLEKLAKKTTSSEEKTELIKKLTNEVTKQVDKLKKQAKGKKLELGYALKPGSKTEIQSIFEFDKNLNLTQFTYNGNDPQNSAYFVFFKNGKINALANS